MKVELISWTNNPIGTAAKAASVCYNSDPDRRIIKQCLDSSHHSVVEHMNFTFKIEGCSRVLSHQLVRHRIASYSQRSQRYCSEDGAGMVTPPSIEKNFAAEQIYNEALDYIQKVYKELQKYVSNEDARFILPNACETTIYMTMNLRTLMHFMNERLCTRAQWEIQKMARLMKEAIKEKQFEMHLDDLDMELILSNLVPKCESGKIKFCPEHKSCGRQRTAKEINEIITESEEKAKSLETKRVFIDRHRDTEGEIFETYECDHCKKRFSSYDGGEDLNFCSNCGAKFINRRK
jgi:thymidylate synthase (FAD)